VLFFGISGCLQLTYLLFLSGILRYGYAKDCGRFLEQPHVCGKTSKVGRSVTFSGERNPRLFKANLHRVKAVLEDGTVKRIYVCTKCLKAGKVVKAVKSS
jgi:large subunit ribosomal protein L28